MDTSTTIALIIAILALAGVTFLIFSRQKTRELKSRFGPEYDRAVDETGDARRAESILDQRQKRVEKYQLRPLTHEERSRLVDEWRSVQESFVDNPRDAIARADGLIGRAMSARGYPMSDFECQAADLSVDHATALDRYRNGHAVAVRSERGQTTTEDLRMAMQHYRAVFDEVAGIGPVREEAHRYAR